MKLKFEPKDLAYLIIQKTIRDKISKLATEKGISYEEAASVCELTIDGTTFKQRELKDFTYEIG